MKGDKNRGEKLFIKIASGDKFKKGVAKVRFDLDIPKNAFVNIEEVSKWNKKPISKKMDELVSIFLKEQRLLENTWWVKKIVEYILFNGKIETFPPLLSTQHPFIEVIYKKSIRDPFTDIRLFPGVTQDDITDFIKNPSNWRFIKPKHKLGPIEKIRLPVNTEVRNIIISLWDKPKKELGEKYNELKETLISKILKEKGYKVSSENVKAIYYRYKNKER